MTRYIAIADAPDPEAPRVQQFGHLPNVYDEPAVKTGLLDAKGVPIYRLANPIGFNRGD